MKKLVTHVEALSVLARHFPLRSQARGMLHSAAKEAAAAAGEAVDRMQSIRDARARAHFNESPRLWHAATRTQGA